MFKKKNILIKIGCFILLINIVGLFIPLRHPDVYQDSRKHPRAENKDSIGWKEVLDFADSNKNNLKSKEYIVELYDMISRTMSNLKSYDLLIKHTRIPFWENYLLFFARFIYPKRYEAYEFCNYRKAIQRGVGLCSQQSMALFLVLKERGFKAKLWGLDGHMVTTAQVDRKKDLWWTFDPDYGVHIEYSKEEIENMPSIVRSPYTKKGYPKELVDKLEKYYGKEGNTTVMHSIDYFGVFYYYFEKISYILKWFIPMIFIIIGITVHKGENERNIK